MRACTRFVLCAPLVTLLLAGCESIAPRTTTDAARDTGAVIDAPQSEDTPDVATADVSAPPDLPSDDVPHVSPGDVPDVIDTDHVDATVEDTLDVVTADAHDATVNDIQDAVSIDTPDVITADTHDVVTADTPDVITADTSDVVTADTPDGPINPFPSTGEDGPFPPPDAGTVVTLAPRIWNFTTVNVPQGMTVRMARGSGVIELRATGDVVIDGVIDVSGGPGASPNSGSFMPTGGGDTGTALTPTSNGGGQGGGGALGAAGNPCGPAGASGGGAGSCRRGGGGGGGGYAGGAGGPGYGGGPAGSGASHLLDQGGIASTELAVPTAGGESDLRGTPLAVYAGGSPSIRPTHCAQGGGGGSVGATAARDLAVTRTFRSGSGGGGGGGGGYINTETAGGGGGGGGGAIRISSPTSIIVSAMGAVRASGGVGGRGSFYSGGQQAGGGGGGSGGAIYFAAPAVALIGTVSASGGMGGLADGQDCSPYRAGGGGLGRVRISTEPLNCIVRGTVTPPVPTGCAPSPDGGVPGQAYVGVWPN